MNQVRGHDVVAVGRALQQRPDRVPSIEARRWLLAGRVQGVGFRPFILRLANEHGLTGWVENQVGSVEIVAQGAPAQLRAFGAALVAKAPPLARPAVLRSVATRPLALADFSIRASAQNGTARVHIPPDHFLCDDCLAELLDPTDRRYRYPFINCTQCGPRYTLIERLPYDRQHTSMASFELCDECRCEYDDPLDRRFHAEPVACPACGPQLRFAVTGEKRVASTADPLSECVKALQSGAIIAVKGIGGYHLMCDARSDDVVMRLRKRKPRPHKPLAVMFPIAGEDGLALVTQAVALSSAEAELLRSPTRPIVLAKKASDDHLSRHIAPGLGEIGVVLPYSPLHALICHEYANPLVATSANITGEPVLTEAVDVQARLGHVTRHFLHHDRRIVRPADDPVYRTVGGKPRPLRLGRGGAPVEVRSQFKLRRPLLAVGGHTKATIALAWEDRVVVSPHIGDMDTPRSLAVFEQLVSDLQSLYGVRAKAVVCDAHPGFATGRWAERGRLPVTKVFHHHAHASALAGECYPKGACLVFTWDGVGFGEDGSLWGGEALLGAPGDWRRVATMRSFSLPGGDKGGREAWRSAAGMCWEAHREWPQCPQRDPMLYRAWQRRLNAPRTSAVGRIFDAAAALTGAVYTTTFEGQAPMQLEALCGGSGDRPRTRSAQCIVLPSTRNAHGIWETDWAPLVPYLMDATLSACERAAVFHTSMAQALLNQALRAREEYAVEQIGLCGGVFQNNVLVEQALSLLETHGFMVHFPSIFPVNDAAISFGQIIEAGAVELA